VSTQDCGYIWYNTTFGLRTPDMVTDGMHPTLLGTQVRALGPSRSRQCRAPYNCTAVCTRCRTCFTPTLWRACCRQAAVKRLHEGLLLLRPGFPRVTLDLCGAGKEGPEPSACAGWSCAAGRAWQPRSLTGRRARSS